MIGLPWTDVLEEVMRQFFRRKHEPYKVKVPAPKAHACERIPRAPAPPFTAANGRLLIGLTGRKQSGKSTVAKILREQQKFIEYSFAAPMRLFIAFMLAPSETGGLAWLEANKETPIDWLDGMTPRHMLQTLGTEWGRDMIHSELWLRKCMRDIADSTAPNIVVSDVRFDNEAKAIREAGGVIVHVVRNTCEGADAHVSEAGVNDGLIDIVVDNSADIAGLESAICGIVLPLAQKIAGDRGC